MEENFVDNKKNINFVSVAFDINLQEAQNQYKEEMRLNVNGIKKDMLSFEQWLTRKQYEALKFAYENFGG